MHYRIQIEPQVTQYYFAQKWSCFRPFNGLLRLFFDYKAIGRDSLLIKVIKIGHEEGISS